MIVLSSSSAGADDAKTQFDSIVKQLNSYEDFTQPGLDWPKIHLLTQSLWELSGKLSPTESVAAAAAIIKLVEMEYGPSLDGNLGKALVTLSKKLKPQEIQPIAFAIGELIQKNHPTQYQALEFLCDTLAELCKTLPSKDLAPLATVLVMSMNENQYGHKALRIAKTLVKLCKRLDAKDASPLAVQVVNEIENSRSDPGRIAYLESLEGLCVRLDAQDAQPLAATFIRLIENERDINNFEAWQFGLEKLTARLGPERIQPLTMAIAKRVEADTDGVVFRSLVQVLHMLCTKRKLQDAQPVATVIVNRMQTEADSVVLEKLRESLTPLVPTLKPHEVAPLASIVFAITEKETNNRNAHYQVLINLSQYLASQDAAALARRAVTRLEAENHAEHPVSETVKSLSKTLRILSRRMEPNDVLPLATDVLTRMKPGEHDRFPLLADLLGANCLKFDPEDARPFASIIIKTILADQSMGYQTLLLGDLVYLMIRLEAVEIQPLAQRIVKQMESPSIEEAEFSSLSRMLACLHTKLDRELSLTSVKLIVRRMKVSDDPELGQALCGLSLKLEPQDVPPLIAEIVQQLHEAKSNLGATNLSFQRSRFSNVKQPDRLQWRMQTLECLGQKLTPQDAEPLAVTLVKMIETEPLYFQISRTGFGCELSDTLVVLVAKLRPETIQKMAVPLVNKIANEKDHFAFIRLAESLAALRAKLELKEIQLLAALIIKRMQTEIEPRWVARLGQSLGRFCDRLEPQDVEPAAMVIIRHMIGASDSITLAELGMAFGSLSSKLKPEQVRSVAVMIVLRMENENDLNSLYRLSQVLENIHSQLDSVQVQPAIDRLLPALKTIEVTDQREILGMAFGNLSAHMEPQTAIELLDQFPEFPLVALKILNGQKGRIRDQDQLQRYSKLLLDCPANRDEILEAIDASGLVGETLYDGEKTGLDPTRFFDFVKKLANN